MGRARKRKKESNQSISVLVGGSTAKKKESLLSKPLKQIALPICFMQACIFLPKMLQLFVASKLPSAAVRLFIPNRLLMVAQLADQPTCIQAIFETHQKQASQAYAHTQSSEKGAKFGGYSYYTGTRQDNRQGRTCTGLELEQEMGRHHFFSRCMSTGTYVSTGIVVVLSCGSSMIGFSQSSVQFTIWLWVSVSLSVNGDKQVQLERCSVCSMDNNKVV